jgi:hypothetical protein
VLSFVHFCLKLIPLVKREREKERKRERGKEGKRERGKEGKRERGKEGKRERADTKNPEQTAVLKINK